MGEEKKDSIIYKYIMNAREGCSSRANIYYIAGNITLEQ